MMKLYSAIRILFVSIVILGIVGCGATRELLDTKTGVNLTFVTSKDLNPDRDGRPSPIVIKVFALSDDRQFKREDFLSLYENPAERLGSDLIETYELKEFSPDETRDEFISLTPETRFIGVMAAFVQYDRADALLILPVTSRKTIDYTIKAERLRIRDMNDNI
jgi:type VI secretion system protein VasD